MNKIILTVVVVLLIGGAFLYFSRSQKPTKSLSPFIKTAPFKTTPTMERTQQQQQMSPTVEPSRGAAEKGVVKEVIVTGSNFKFQPSTIMVKKGDTVKITFKNSGGFHNFTIDEFNVATKQIGTGSEATVQFTADKVGTFEYYCSVGNHRQMGMRGQLIVQ